MQSRRFSVIAVGLAGVALVGLATFTGASPTPRGQTAPKPVPPADPSALIAQGKLVYASLDCNTCHLLNKAGTAVGPDLSAIGKTCTPAKLKTVIRTPLKITPKGFMPAYDKTKINATQLKGLVAYLASLK